MLPRTGGVLQASSQNVKNRRAWTLTVYVMNDVRGIWTANTILMLYIIIHLMYSIIFQYSFCWGPPGGLSEGPGPHFENQASRGLLAQYEGLVGVCVCRHVSKWHRRCNNPARCASYHLARDEVSNEVAAWRFTSTIKVPWIHQWAAGCVPRCARQGRLSGLYHQNSNSMWNLPMIHSSYRPKYYQRAICLPMWVTMTTLLY